MRSRSSVIEGQSARMKAPVAKRCGRSGVSTVTLADIEPEHAHRTPGSRLAQP
jgi:hypothetical protein